MDLKALARDVVGEFRPTAKSHRSRLEVRGRGHGGGDGRSRPGQPDHPYPDRQCAHAFSQGTAVTVTAVSGDNTAELIVGDDGQGIEPRARRARLRPLLHRRQRLGLGPRAWRSPTSSRRAWAASLEVVSKRGFTAFTLSLPLAESGARQRKPAEAAA